MDKSASKSGIPISTLSRWGVSTALLLGLLWWLGPTSAFLAFQSAQPQWIGLALVVGTIQVFASAWRWRFTAQCLGLDLSYRKAVREYYLASFINQVLPGGVVGDLYRAKRHSDSTETRAPAWQAVMVERFSGQLVLMLLTLCVVLASPLWRELLWSFPETRGPIGLIVLLVITAVLVGLVLGRQHVGLRRAFDFVGVAMSQSFWPMDRLVIQLIGSTLIVSTYVGVFVLAARASGIELPVLTIAALAPPLLLSMVVPITVAGWGLREWVAALSWGAVGLDPAQGVAVSVTYGALIFLTALPGVVMWRDQRKPNSIKSSSPH